MVLARGPLDYSEGWDSNVKTVKEQTFHKRETRVFRDWCFYHQAVRRRGARGRSREVFEVKEDGAAAGVSRET